MALNDGVLADLGIAPVVVAAAATTVAQIIGGTGPTEEFLQRQAYRDAKDEIVAKYKAILPSLKDWERAIISKDLDEFVYRMTRDNMSLGDYKAAFAWFQGREVAWQSMTGPDPSVQIEPGITANDLRRRIYEGTWRAAAERGELPLGVTPGTPIPEFVTEPAGVAPVGVVTQQAGFNWPAILVLGGVVAYLAFGRK